MTTLFISDLHLSGERPAIIDLFLQFLHDEAAQSEALYILGDLFEAWIGDDHIEPALFPVIQTLHTLTSGGLKVFVMAGNRDFLMGKGFEHDSGCQLLQDPSVINLYGTPTLLLHGDTLCTDDVDYQALRQRFRDPNWQRQFLTMPVEQRLQFAQKARSESRAATRTKSETIMDVNAEAVAMAFEDHQVTRLIHGHTHRPYTHHWVDKQGQTLTRIVLGDWYQRGSVLRCDTQQCTLASLSL